MTGAHARIRATLGPCAGVDPDAHAAAIAAEVARVRIREERRDPALDLQAEARRIASRTMTDGLQTEGSIS